MSQQAVQVPKGTNIILGDGNSGVTPANGLPHVLDSKNIVIGSGKAATSLGVAKMEATVGSVVIGHGSLAANVPSGCVMLGNDCASPANSGVLAFNATRAIVVGAITDATHGIHIEHNGVRYLLMVTTVGAL